MTPLSLGSDMCVKREASQISRTERFMEAHCCSIQISGAGSVSCAANVVVLTCSVRGFFQQGKTGDVRFARANPNPATKLVAAMPVNPLGDDLITETESTSTQSRH